VTSRVPRFLLAIFLMALSANYFLKYLWWTAFYNGSSGFGSHAQQVQQAASRSTTYLWIVIALVLVTVIVTSSAMRPRAKNSSRVLSQGARLAASLVLTLAGTALLALILAWIQPGVR
jgi:magnesium-transporting ATPase (P-type)